MKNLTRLTKRQLRTLYKKAKKRLEITIYRLKNQKSNRGFFNKGRREFSEFQYTVNTMTNRERNAWARAGYPGADKQDIDVVKQYIFNAEMRLVSRKANKSICGPGSKALQF